MPAVDAFVHSAALLTSPPKNAFAITPNNAAEIPYVTRAIFVGTGGDLAVTMAAGEQVVFKGVASGSLLPMRIIAVRSTGTTATDIIGLY